MGEKAKKSEARKIGWSESETELKHDENIRRK